MSNEEERIDSLLNDLAAERDPALRSALSAEEQELAQTAAFLKSAAPSLAVPRETFVQQLEARITDHSGTKAEGRQRKQTKTALSRRNVLGAAAAAMAGLAVGGGATAAAAYDHGKHDGFTQEEVEALSAPMVPKDRGQWMDSGIQASTVLPGQAARFRTGAIEGFIYNPGGNRPLYALSAACTHMGCILSWGSASGTFVCPCHGAQYNPNGTVLTGIARHPLPRIDIQIDKQGNVQVWSIEDQSSNTTLVPYTQP